MKKKPLCRASGENESKHDKDIDKKKIKIKATVYGHYTKNSFKKKQSDKFIEQSDYNNNSYSSCNYL